MTNRDTASMQEFYFRLSGSGNAPWEIHQPQPAIVKLVEEGVFQGKILDIGCGLGDNAIYIAKNAKIIHITAVDMVPKAIEVAVGKSIKQNVNIQFEVVNILDDLSKTSLKRHSYDVLLDAAIFHVFSNEDRQRYIKNLEYLIKPGGLYIQLCISEKETRQGGPYRIKKSDLIEVFSPINGWSIESIEDTIYESRPDAPLGIDGRAYLSFIRHNK